MAYKAPVQPQEPVQLTDPNSGGGLFGQGSIYLKLLEALANIPGSDALIGGPMGYLMPKGSRAGLRSLMPVSSEFFQEGISPESLAAPAVPRRPIPFQAEDWRAAKPEGVPDRPFSSMTEPDRFVPGFKGMDAHEAAIVSRALAIAKQLESQGPTLFRKWLQEHTAGPPQALDMNIYAAGQVNKGDLSEVWGLPTLRNKANQSYIRTRVSDMLEQPPLEPQIRGNTAYSALSRNIGRMLEQAMQQGESKRLLPAKENKWPKPASYEEQYPKTGTGVDAAAEGEEIFASFHNWSPNTFMSHYHLNQNGYDALRQVIGSADFHELPQFIQANRVRQ